MIHSLVHMIETETHWKIKMPHLLSQMSPQQKKLEDICYYTEVEK